MSQNSIQLEKDDEIHSNDQQIQIDAQIENGHLNLDEEEHNNKKLSEKNKKERKKKSLKHTSSCGILKICFKCGCKKRINPGTPEIHPEKKENKKRFNYDPSDVLLLIYIFYF
jgi:hypothetical protein